MDMQAKTKSESGSGWRKSVKRFAKNRLAGIGEFLVRQSTLPDRPVYDVKDFPWVGELEANYPTIRRELDTVLGHRSALPKLHELQKQQYRISADDKWKAFVLFGWDIVSEPGQRFCPETSRLVQKIPGLRSAFFSILDAGARIPEHRGHFRGLLRGQMALIVPKEKEKCFLRVEDNIIHWQEGKAFVFDDWYLHEVQNNTDEERVVLILHFDRPMNRLGRITQKILVAIIRRTSFVKQAVRNHEEWEKRFREQMPDSD